MADPSISVEVTGSEIVGCGNVDFSGSGFTPHGKISLRGTGSVVVAPPWMDVAIADKKGNFAYTITYGTPGDGCVAPSKDSLGTLKIEAKDNKSGKKTSTEISVKNCWMQLGSECW